MSVDWKSWAVRLAFAVAGAILEAVTQLLHSVGT